MLYMQMGSVIQREVQHAHLWQIGEDVKAGQLVKAAQHLQYLHEDFAPSEAECRFFVISGWVLIHSFAMVAVLHKCHFAPQLACL